MRHAPLFTLILAALLPAGPAAAQEAAPANLRPQWALGQTATYEFWSKMQKDEAAEILGQTQEKTTTYVSEGKVTWTIDALNDDGSATCTMKMTHLKFTITSGEQGPVVMDSDNPSGEQPVFDQLIAAIVQTPMTVTVNADGTIAQVKGIEELSKAAGQEAVDADVIPSELDMKESASELATLIAAPASATPGQTWNAKYTWNQDNVLPGAEAVADYDTTFTLASLGRIAGVPIATVKAESDIDIKVDLSKLPENAPDIDIQIQDAKGKGEILFDLSRHETVARHDSMSYTANVTITPPNPQVPPIQVKITEQNQSQLLRISESSSQ